MAFTVTRFDSKAFCGYTQITTFYEDFGIADHFGTSAIKDTYKRAFKGWKNDYKFLTELTMVLNWKSWEWVDKNNIYSELYADLYYECRDWALDNLKGDKLTYFIRTTD